MADFDSPWKEALDLFFERWLNQGRLEGIEAILEIRFPAATSQLMFEIRQIHDHEQLKKIHRAAATLSCPDELRKPWASGVAD